MLCPKSQKNSKWMFFHTVISNTAVQIYTSFSDILTEHVPKELEAI